MIQIRSDTVCIAPFRMHLNSTFASCAISA